MKNARLGYEWLIKVFGALFGIFAYSGPVYSACTPTHSVTNANGDVINYCSKSMVCYNGVSGGCLYKNITRYYFFLGGCAVGRHSAGKAMGSMLSSRFSSNTSVPSCGGMLCNGKDESLASYTNYAPCSTCPAPGTTSNTTASNISFCYAPTGTTGSDETGSYALAQNCYYKP